MPRFRFLTDEELSHLQEEFKQFLVVNAIYHEEWIQMNQNTPEKALEIVGIFSDSVLSRVYEKISFLEQYSTHSFLTFLFDGKSAKLIAVKSENDISTPELLREQLDSNINQLEFFKSERLFPEDSLDEIHRLIEQGAVVSDGFLWTKLSEFIL